MQTRLGLLAALFPFSCLLFGQNRADSTAPLQPERLLEADILGRAELSKKSEVISATRTATDVEEQPFTVFVVTAEEIARNNFVTLADALRTVPGIRVSQPGSALDGETFLMRGLRGNGYAKILINDVPIKPSAVGGLPIGGQLPIRQAERIEILYGPAAAIYGGDACAGVINIILKETERPLFNQAALSFGSNSYNALDLFFGGKLGRDRNIFRFAIYGSSTVMDDRAVYSDTALFNVGRYLFEPNDKWAWLASRNYRSSGEDRLNKTETPQFSKTPHESRLFGLNLTWRGIHFTYHRMLRRDQSSLGLSPLAVAYASPQNILGERTETFSIGAKRQKRRGGIDYNLSAVRYRMENRSNFSFVRPTMNEAWLRLRGLNDPLLASSAHDFQSELEQRYFGQERYARSSSVDLRQEIRGSWRFGGGWQWDLGNVLAFQSASPLALFLPVPFERKSGEGAQPIRQLTAATGSANFYSQLVWQRRGFFGLVGTSVNFEPQFQKQSTRAAFRARANSWLSIRGVWAEGYRAPSPFYRANSFWLDTVGYRAEVRTTHFSLEKTRSGELGASFLLKRGRKLDAVAFLTKSQNLLTNGHFNVADDEYGFRKGYFGWRGTGAMSTQGLQMAFSWKEWRSEEVEFFKKTVREIHASHQISWTLTKGSFADSDFGTAGKGAPGLPARILRWQWLVRFDELEFSGRHDWESSAATAQTWWQPRWNRFESREQTPKYATTDLTIRFFLSKNFKIYGEAINVFDAHFFGLDATGSPDDLLANPQTGRQFRLGIRYDMN